MSNDSNRGNDMNESNTTGADAPRPTQTEAKHRIYEGLVELFERSRDLDALYEHASGVVEGEQAETLEQLVERSREQTLEGLCHFHAEADGVQTIAEKEIERLSAVVDRQKARKKWATDRALDVLRLAGVKRIEVGTRIVFAKKNPGHVEQDGEVNLALLDPDLVREVPAKLEPKKSEIGRVLKDGGKVPGFKWVNGEEKAVIQ